MKPTFVMLTGIVCLLPGSLVAQPRLVDVGGVELLHEDTGRGIPLVLIHGWMNDHRTWLDQVPSFSLRHRVIRYDRRGWGLSTGTPDVAADPADLNTLLDSLGLDRVVVLGHSQGAEVALRFAVAFPERVRALILYGVGPPAGFGLAWDGPDQIPDLRGLSPDSVQARLFRHPLAWFPPGLVLPPDVNAMFATNIGRDVEGRSSERGTPAARMDQLRGIRVPTLVIIGDHELPYIQVVADALTYGITGARKMVIEEAGHAAHLGQPDRFNRAILEFLATVGEPPL